MLCSQRFEILDDYAAVGEAAEAIISDINRAATFVLPDFQGAHRGRTVEQRPEQLLSLFRRNLWSAASPPFWPPTWWATRAS